MTPSPDFRGRIAAAVLAAALALAAPAPAQTPRPDVLRDGGSWPVVPLGRQTFMGVTLLDLTPELREHFGAPRDAGVMISEVRRDSPAARAGIAVGDVVTRIDGQAVDRFRDLSRVVAGHAKGDRVEVELVRNRAAKKVSVTLDERDTDAWLRRKTVVIGPHDGEAGRTIVIDGDEALPPESGEVMERFFRNPGWQAKMGDFNECERVRKRLEEVEERLKTLEQKLASK